LGAARRTGAPAASDAREERLELLGGTMELDVGGERNVLCCGHEAVVIPPGTPHGWRNAGADVLHFMFDLELIG